MFLLPAYSPGLNPVEGVWVHVERSLANLAVMALGRLERLQYRPDTSTASQPASAPLNDSTPPWGTRRPFPRSGARSPRALSFAGATLSG
ncbi:hypothetical protein ACIA8H_32405 [Streptomyces goshikiensis]|uniref:hypothetical protein n=1 Tax=Streptomyces goshikiensis TaxID=1942 RepID=UPI003795E08D